jgi:hypothetical protein
VAASTKLEKPAKVSPASVKAKYTAYTVGTTPNAISRTT